MSSTHVAFIVAVLVVIGGAIWYTRTPDSAAEVQDQSLGSFAYTCTNDVSFIMTPAVDLSVISIAPVSGSVYPPSSVLVDSPTDAGRRFRGEEFEFHGQGESARLYVVDTGTTYECTPQPRPDEPPFNFGD